MKGVQIQGFKANPVLLRRFIRWLKSYLFAMAIFAEAPWVNMF
jgi:hypothetical protein